ncbi:MAG TPA: type I-B CRISPR-associated protein Cas8b1/Cst1 [Smithellaceae bacterium]|nr:type I-B CRISPR-associated protein Cas8b1/Cst1 [Smithellaceae bacterium]
MKHRIYMRDWFFNAGIIGFLQVVSEGKDIENISDVNIGDNYIEFDDNALDDFGPKFIKQSFLLFFNKYFLISKLNKSIKNIDEVIQKKTKGKPVKKEIEFINKFPYSGFISLIDKRLDDKLDPTTYTNICHEIIRHLEEHTDLQIYSTLMLSDGGNAFIKEFVTNNLIGVTTDPRNRARAFDKISEFIQAIKEMDYARTVQNESKCVSCQNEKVKGAEVFSTAISGIIGFNKDNSNWVWGFKDSKAKICNLCALIYNIAFLSFAYIYAGERKFFFVNYNSTVLGQWKTIQRFILEIKKHHEKPAYAMIKETVRIIRDHQMRNIRENVNFIEIPESTVKGYNILSYNIDSDIAEFLHPYLQNNTMPKGFYIIKDAYFNLDEQLLKSTVTRQVDYGLLHTFLSLWLQGRKNQNNEQKKANIVAAYQPSYIIEYVLDYINKCVRRDTMDINKGIVKKAFRNGIELKQKLLAKNKENQIDGIIYQLLNDLKIADREKFIDKYMRLVMSHGLPSMFGEAEMLDKDAFLQFGYSFINGIMSQPKQSE